LKLIDAKPPINDAEKVIEHAESVRGWTRGSESEYTKQAI